MMAVQPALVETVLERVARRVAARAVVVHDPSHAEIVGGLGGKAGEDQVAGHLPHLALGVVDLGEREIAPRAGFDVDLGGGRLEAQRLRPHAVLPCRQRREVIGAGLVGEDGGGDGRAHGLRRNRDAAELFAGRCGDGAGQDGGIGRRGGQARERGQDGGCAGGAKGNTRVLHGRLLQDFVQRVGLGFAGVGVGNVFT